MRLKSLLLKVLLATLPFVGLVPCARAQIEAYATVSPTHLSNVVNGNAVDGSYSYGSYWTTGVGGGVTLNLLPLPVISLGIDLRGSTRPGTNGTDTAMAGIKLGAKLPIVHLKPYVEAAGGYVGTRTRITTGIGTTAGGTDTQRWAGFEILGGVDVPVARLLSLRLIEVGAGTATLISGPNRNVRNLDLLTLNSGVVLRF